MYSNFDSFFHGYTTFHHDKENNQEYIVKIKPY